MIRNPLLHAALAVLALAPAPLLAQAAPAAAPGANDIVVEGTRNQVREQLARVLQTSGGQIARFETQFCPIVIGFPAEWTPILENLIRANVEQAGRKVEPRGCTPTAVVIFIDEPQRLVTELHKAMPGLFEGMAPADYRTLTDQPRTAYGWRVIDLRDRDGRPLENAGSVNGEGVQGVKIVRNATNSRLVKSVRQEIMSSFVVLDLKRTPGMTLRQIADFATLNLLLDLKPGARERLEAGSILSLFDAADPAAAPPRMAAFDEGMLKGLYAQRENNLDAKVQRGRIARAMKQGADEQND